MEILKKYLPRDISLSIMELLIGDYISFTLDDIKALKSKIIHWSSCLAYAIKIGDMKIFHYVEQHILDASSWKSCMQDAADVNRLDLVKYCESKAITLNKNKKLESKEWLFCVWHASARGYLNIVKYAWFMGAKCSAICMYEASWGGHLDVVKYAESVGATNFGECIEVASENGHLNIVKRFWSKCNNMDLREICRYNSESHNYDEMLEYIESHFYKHYLI
uniref:Ankyrin repeat protein n=1 Tax=Pithovirus LCPAC406 TaxID=2506599 RepID=A0A481ZDY8_9VIRU|nr:MAG: ankyrin repeat protein [Pithovirus LCPAC406]